MLEAFAKAYADTGEEQPIMVTASHFTAIEILATAELGCHHITIQAELLKTLMETPATLPSATSRKTSCTYRTLTTPQRLRGLSTQDPLAGPGWDGVLASMKTDYISNDGALLDECIREDVIVNARLNDATQFFLDAENDARLAIEQEMAVLCPM